MSGGEPFFAGAIHGVRSWRVRDGSTLSGLGLGSRERWAPAGRATTARCLNATHPAPMAACECGLYALHPRGSIGAWRPDPLEASVTGLVEAWGRIELHRDGFRAELARPKVLFAPARHLVSGAYLERLHRVAARYRVPVVELPRPEHALEWCRIRGLGLSREAVEDSFLQDVALRLRRVRRVSHNGERVTIGVWPERLENPTSGGDPWPAPHTRVDRLPGITICRIAARGPDAEAVLKEPGFDPGRSLRLAIGGSPARKRIEVWDQHRELRLGEVHRPTGRRLARDLRSNRIGEVRALTRTVVLRGRAAGRRWLTILVAPPISISIDQPEAEDPTLPGRDWWAPEPGEDR